MLTFKKLQPQANVCAFKSEDFLALVLQQIKNETLI